jgi:hypothetical protein
MLLPMLSRYLLVRDPAYRFTDLDSYIVITMGAKRLLLNDANPAGIPVATGMEMLESGMGLTRTRLRKDAEVGKRSDDFMLVLQPEAD